MYVIDIFIDLFKANRIMRWSIKFQHFIVGIVLS